MGIFPKDRGENKKYLKPPPSIICSYPGVIFWDAQGLHSSHSVNMQAVRPVRHDNSFASRQEVKNSRLLLGFVTWKMRMEKSDPKNILPDGERW